MKEAVQRGDLQPVAASDFGDWTLRGWRHLHSLPDASEEERSIVLLLIHWLGKRDRNQSWPIEWVRAWWQHVVPLCSEVAASGDPHGTFHLFFQFQDTAFHDIAEPSTILDLVEGFVARLDQDLAANAVSLDDASDAGGMGGRHSWRDIAGYAADAIAGFRRAYSAREHNRAYALLDRLASDPICSPKASAALLQLQDEEGTE